MYHSGILSTAQDYFHRSKPKVYDVQNQMKDLMKSAFGTLPPPKDQGCQ